MFCHQQEGSYWKKVEELVVIQHIPVTTAKEFTGVHLLLFSNSIIWQLTVWHHTKLHETNTFLSKKLQAKGWFRIELIAIYWRVYPFSVRGKKGQLSATRNAREVLRNTVHGSFTNQELFCGHLINQELRRTRTTHTRLPPSRTVALLPSPIAASLHPSKSKQRNKLKNKHQTKSRSKQSHAKKRGEATDHRRSYRRARKPPGTRASARPSALPCRCNC